MVARKTATQIAKESETPKYFAKEWGFKYQANFKVGSEVYVIPLDITNGVFTANYHDVKAKSKTNCLNNSQFGTAVKCTKETGHCTACDLAKLMYEKYPKTGDTKKDAEQAVKRIISGSRERVWIPVLILGNSETDTNKKQIPPQKLSLKTYKFSYLEMSNRQYQEQILNVMKNKLKDEGVIEYDLSDEESLEEVNKFLNKCIIRVRGVATSFQPNNDNVASKEYSFIPFSAKSIGMATGEHDAIANYQSNTALMNDITDFLTLFSSEIDNTLTSVSDEVLKSYVLEANEKTEAVEQFKKVSAEEEQAQLAQESYTEEQFKEDVSTIEDALTDDEISFDTDDEFNFDEEEAFA